MPYLLKEQRIIFSWTVHTTHSIQGRSVITFESLYVHREKQPDTTEVKTALAKFIFENAKMLRHNSILLHPTSDCLNSHFIKLTKWLKSPFVLASQTVSVRTSVRPCFHTTKNLANAATGFLKTGQYPNFLRAPKGRWCSQTTGNNFKEQCPIPKRWGGCFWSFTGWWMFVI